MGHLACAQEAHDQLRLDAVWFVPFGQPPHREVEQDPGAEARFAMCELATAGDARFRASRIEIDRPGPSYTAETLREVHAREDVDELFVVLGADQAAALPDWHEPAEVLRLATVAVADRGDFSRAHVEERVASVAGEAGGGVVFFEMPRLDVSSTLVRRRAAAGRPIRYLVPEPVAEFVAARNLYRSSAPVAAS